MYNFAHTLPLSWLFAKSMERVVIKVASNKENKSYSEAKDLMLANPVLSQRKIHFVNKFKRDGERSNS